MLPYPSKRSIFTLLFVFLALFTIFYFPQPFPPKAYALDSNNCENGWTFNGGDAGDDNNWEYTGCEEGGGNGGNNDDNSGDDSDNNNNDDDDNNNNGGGVEAGYCENGWTFKGGDAGDDDNWRYTGCGQDDIQENSDNSEEDCNRAGGSWRDDRCFTSSSSISNNNQVSAGYCENGWTFKGGDAGDNNSWEYTACGLGEVDSDSNEQECNKAGGSWRDNRCYTASSSSNVTAGYCENGWLFKGGDAGDNNSWVYNGCGIDGSSSGENDGACPSNQYWDINSGGCVNSNNEQAAINDEIYCRDVCSGSCEGGLGAKYCVNSDGSRKFDCSNPADQWKAECQNQLLNEFKNTGLEPVDTNNYQACGFADLTDSGCVGVQYCRLHILYCDGEPKGEAKPGGNCELVAGKCGVEQDESGNKYVAETGQPAVAVPISESGEIINASIPNPQELQSTKDASCKETNAIDHYCDGNICIEKSSGWDGEACVNVYTTVNASACPNSCAGDNATSGETVKLLNCLDEPDPAKRAECNKENNRIAQTGQKLDQSSLLRSSLNIDDCTSLEGDAKEACENKNADTRFLARVLDTVKLENCISKTADEKTSCDSRNSQAIKEGQIRLNLGIEDCSNLSGDKKTNCEFTNYQRDQITQAAVSFTPEDCSKYQTESEKSTCQENNQKRYSEAVNNVSPFVGLAELGASCVYPEACADGGKKACAGKIASDNGAPVCKYDPAQASCSACTTENLNLTNKENKCSEDGQTCLNAPGYNCINDAHCQTKTAALQQAAADAPIDPARLFSQKFEEGKVCLQPEICDLGDGTQGEHVCNGKGNAEGKCDLSQGGGVCSACQAKGTIKINKEATCNSENKCIGAPALSGCMNDEQCKPVVVTPARTIKQGGVAGPGQVTLGDNCVYNAVLSCKKEETRAADFYTTSFSNSPDARDLNTQKAVEQHGGCVTDYIKVSCPTYITEAPVYAAQAVTNHVQYNYAVTEASTATNQLDQFGAAVVRDLGYIPVESAQKLEQLQSEQQAALERLRKAETTLNLPPQASLALDRSTTDSQVAGLEKVNQILDLDRDINRSLAQTAAARNQFNQDSIGNSAESEAVAQRYDEFEKAREQTQEKISQLATLKGESGKGQSQFFQNQLDQLPTKADEQFKDQKTVSEVNQLSNLARQSNSPDVVFASQNALVDRVEDLESRGKTDLALNLQRQSVQASFEGWSNVYASQLSQAGGDSEKGGTFEAQDQMQNLIAVARLTDAGIADKMQNEYASIAPFVQAQQVASQARNETIRGILNISSNRNQSFEEGVEAFSAVQSNAATAQEQLDQLNERVCKLSQSRCQALLVKGTGNTGQYITRAKGDAFRAEELLAEQNRLLPEIYQLQRTGASTESNQFNNDGLIQNLARSREISRELAVIDPNLALRTTTQTNETLAAGQAQRDQDFAANTYARNRELLLTFERSQNGDAGVPAFGIDPQTEIQAAEARMHDAINQMADINPQKAALMQQDFNLTTYKLDSLPQGSEFVGKNGCVVEVCNGNGLTAQNICSGGVSGTKNFDPFCAAQNGNTDPQTAWNTYLEVNRQAATPVVSPQSDSSWTGTANVALAAVSSLPSGIGELMNDWWAREIESKTPVFLGDAETQRSCRENTTIVPFIGGAIPTNCQVDNRTKEEKDQIAAQAIQNGGRINEMLSAVSGEKATSDINKRTLERIAEETGVDLNTPVLYWTNTQRSEFNKKLEGYYGGGFTDVFDSVVFPTTAFSEANEAAARCSAEWGKGVCSLNAGNASTYLGLTQGDEVAYQQSVERAKSLFPEVEAVPQSQMAWVVNQISGAQSANRVNILEKGTTISRDDFASEEEYLNALNANLSQSVGSTISRNQLIDEMTLANARGQGPEGVKMTRQEIEKAVDTYLALGYFGENVVANSQAYTWQKKTENEFNSQVAQVIFGAVTIAGPLEFFDPTNPIINGVIKVTTKGVSIPAKGAIEIVDNLAERFVYIPRANKAIETGLGISDESAKDAVRAYFNGRVSGKSVDEAIAGLTPNQNLAFGQATSQIASALGVNIAPDRVIASTILDSVLNPQVVGAREIFDRGGIIASLTQAAENNNSLTRAAFDNLAKGGVIKPAEVDALAAQGVFDRRGVLDYITPVEHQVYARQAVQQSLAAEGVIPVIKSSDVDKLAADLKTRVEIPSVTGESPVRARIINGSEDGVRFGQATTEESTAITRLLEPDSSQRANAARLIDQWNNLADSQKDQVLTQVAREVTLDRAAARQIIDQTPVSGNQAWIQLGNRAVTVDPTVSPGAFGQAANMAKAVIPEVGNAVAAIARGSDLTESHQAALNLSGINEDAVRAAVNGLADSEKAGLARAVQADPRILASADIEQKLITQGLTPNEAQTVKTAFQNIYQPSLAVTPPTPQPGIFQRVANGWNDFNESLGYTKPAQNSGTAVNNAAPNTPPAPQSNTVNTPQQPTAPITSTTSIPSGVTAGTPVTSNVTTPPLTPANPTVPSAPGWFNRTTSRIGGWLQVADRPLNWLYSKLNSAPANPSLVSGGVLDRSAAANIVSKASNDISRLESEVAAATQLKSDLLINRLLVEQDIKGLEARRSNILWRWGKRNLNIGDDLEIQLGLKKGELDKIDQAIKTNSDDLQTKNRTLATARTELKQAEDVLNPTSISSQVNVRSTKERELAKRADDLAKAKNELTYTPIEIWQEKQTGQTAPTLIEKLTTSQQKLASLQAQMARDSENISVLTPEMQQRWLAAYNRVTELEGDTATPKAVLDQAREELRAARQGLAFRKVSEKTYAEALAARNGLKSEYEKLYFDANAAALDVNKLTTEVDYYRAKVLTSAASGNEINDANRRLLNTLSPTAGFSEASGFGLWKQPAKTDVAFFMDTTGRLGISDAGKQGLWVIARYQKSGDGTVILDQIILPHTAPQNLRESAKAATPGKWVPGKLSGDIKIIAESEFNSTFASAQKVNTQQIPIVINPAAASTRSVIEIEREVVMDFTGFGRVRFDPSSGQTTLINPVTNDQIRAALIRQGMRDTDPALPAAIQRISDEINPKVAPVSQTPPTANTQLTFRETSQGELTTKQPLSLTSADVGQGIESVFTRKVSDLPNTDFDLEAVLGPSYTRGRNGIYYEVLGDGNTSPATYRKMYLKFADQTEFARFIEEFKKTDSKGAVVTLKQETDFDEIVFYISYDPAKTTKADLDQIVGNAENLVNQANAAGVKRAEITGYGLYSEDPVGVFVTSENGQIRTTSLATSPGSGSASNDAFAAQVVYSNLVDIARSYTSVSLNPAQAQTTIRQLFQTNPAAAAQMRAAYENMMAISGRNPLVPNTNRLITITVDPADGNAVTRAVELAASYQKNGYDVRVIDSVNVNTSSLGSSFTRTQYDNGSFTISDQANWNNLQQKLQSATTQTPPVTVSQVTPNSPVVQNTSDDAIAGFSTNQSEYYKNLEAEKQFQDLHQLFFHSTDPVERANTLRGLGLPNDLTETQYFQLLDNLKNERIQSAVALTTAEETAVRAALRSDLPRDVAPVPVTPAQAVVNSAAQGVENTAEAIRTVGDGTIAEPVTSAAADWIEDVQRLFDPINDSPWVGVTQEQRQLYLLRARQEQTNLLIMIRESENEYVARLKELNLDPSTVRQSVLDADSTLRQLSDEIYYLRNELDITEAKIRVIEDLGFFDPTLVHEEQILSGSIIGSDEDIKLAREYRQKAKELGPFYATEDQVDEISDAIDSAFENAPAPVQVVANAVADTADVVAAVVRGNVEPFPGNFVSSQIRNNSNVQGYSYGGILGENTPITITFKNNPATETKTLAEWRADSRLTSPEIPVVPDNSVSASVPSVSHEEAMAETIRAIKGWDRIFDRITWIPEPIPESQIRNTLIRQGFSGTPDQLDQAVADVARKVNPSPVISPRQVVSSIPAAGPLINAVADTADLVNGARVVAADELERAAGVARVLGNNDLALTLEGQAQILRRGDVGLDDVAIEEIDGVSLQSVEQRLGRTLSTNETRFVSEALRAQQATDDQFLAVALRLGGQYVPPADDEVQRILNKGLNIQRGDSSVRFNNDVPVPADLSQARRVIEYSSDGIPLNINWYGPGSDIPFAVSRFDIGGYIIRPAIRVEDPNYITLFRGVGRVVPERAEVPPMVRNGIVSIGELEGLIAKGNSMTDQDVLDLLSKSKSPLKDQLIADFKSEAVRIRGILGQDATTLEVISYIHADCGANSECLSFLISSTNDFDFAFEWATGKKSPRTSASGAEAVEILRVPKNRTINLIDNNINPEEQEVAILGQIEDIWRQGVIYVRAKNIDEYHQVLNRFGQTRNAMEEAGKTVIPFEVSARFPDAAKDGALVLRKGTAEFEALTDEVESIERALTDGLDQERALRDEYGQIARERNDFRREKDATSDPNEIARLQTEIDTRQSQLDALRAKIVEASDETQNLRHQYADIEGRWRVIDDLGYEDPELVLIAKELTLLESYGDVIPIEESSLARTKYREALERVQNGDAVNKITNLPAEDNLGLTRPSYNPLTTAAEVVDKVAQVIPADTPIHSALDEVVRLIDDLGQGQKNHLPPTQQSLKQAESNLLTLKQERGTLANQIFALESKGWSISDPFGGNKNQELSKLRPLLEAKNQEIRLLERQIKDLKYQLTFSPTPPALSQDMIVSGKNGFRPYDGIEYPSATLSQFEQEISIANPTWVKLAPPSGDFGGSGADVMQYFDPTTGRGYVSKYVQGFNQDHIASMFVQIDLLHRGAESGLFPRIEKLLTNANGEIRGYVMERFIGQELSTNNIYQLLPTVSTQDKKDFLVRMLAYYDQSKVAHGDIYNLNNGRLTTIHNIFVVNQDGRNQLRLIDPLPKDNYIGPSGYLDIINNRSNYYVGQIDEARALIDIIFTEQEKQDYFVRAMANRLDQERQTLINTRSTSTSFSDMVRQETSRSQSFVSGSCDLTFNLYPSSSNYLAQTNQTSNVLGASTGEVLAASSGPCGPFASAWLEISKSQPSQIIDGLTGGKMGDAYTDLFVKVDASLPESVLKAGNQLIDFFKKIGSKNSESVDSVASTALKVIPTQEIEEIPVSWVQNLNKEKTFLKNYFDKIKSGEINQEEGRYLLYFDTQRYRFEINNLSSSDRIIPIEIQVSRQADSSLQISEIKLPGGWVVGSVSMEIRESLEQLTGNKIYYITGVPWPSLKVSESTIPSIISPNLTTVVGQLLTNPDPVRLYANRQIEQNMLIRSLEALLGDNYLPLKQLALPAPDPLIPLTRELDSMYSLYKSGDIDQPQLIRGVESIAGIQMTTQKIQEVPLFIDERFLRTGLVTGRDIEDIKHWFGGEEWAGWLGARTIAQTYGERPLTTGFIQNLHEALLLPTTPKENVLIGEFRERSIYGFKKDNPGQFPVHKVEAINSNPYIKFIETPAPEGVVTTPDTKWGYLQYPQSRDSLYIDSLPDNLKAKLSPRPTNQELVQVLVEDIVGWYNIENNKVGVDKIALAAELQRKLVSVHPFGDANGRLSRVIMSWALENAGYPSPRIANFNADIETSLPQWIEIVRTGIAREQRVAEKLKLMEEIGQVDQVEALGYSELKTFYDLVSRDGSFANNVRSLPEVNGKIVSKPGSRLGDLDREIVLAWNEFRENFTGESQVLADGTKIEAGGLVPQSYIDLVRMRNPQNFEAYDKLISNIYSNREIPAYRGIQLSTPVDTPQKVAALFEAPRSGLNSYYSNTFSSSKSPQFLRLQNPKMSAADVYWESMAKGLEDYNTTVIDDYLKLQKDKSIQMEDKADSLRRKIKIHTDGDPLYTKVSPFVSLSVNEVVANNFAGATYMNPFFNTFGEPNKKQAGILVTSKLPSKGVIPTFNTTFDGWAGVPPQIIPGLGSNLTIHIGENEVLVPGGMHPAFMERIQVKVRPSSQEDNSWKYYKFDAVKTVKKDGIYIEVKEMGFTPDGYQAGAKNSTLFKLNPLTGKYEEISGINKIESMVKTVFDNRFPSDSKLDEFLSKPIPQVNP